MGGHQARRIGLHVDELVPEQVLAEQHLADAPLEAPQAELLPRQTHRAGSELRDPVNRHEQLAPTDLGLQAGHRWVAAIGEAHDQILDPPEPLAAAIEQRAAQDTRQVEHRG